MSVIVTNVSAHDDLTGPNDYVVRINNGHVLARFTHVRADGLAACLMRAAEAVASQNEGRELGVHPAYSHAGGGRG